MAPTEWKQVDTKPVYPVYFPKLFLWDKMEITVIAIIYEVFALCQI